MVSPRGPLGREQPRRGDPGWPAAMVVVVAVSLLIGGFSMLASSDASVAAEPEQTAVSLATPSPDVTDAPEQAPLPQPSRQPATSPAVPAPVTVTVDRPSSPLRLPESISGTRSPGAEVQVQRDDGSGQPLCIAPADPSSTWSCTIRTLPSGAAIPLRVVALGSGTTAETQVQVAWLDAPTLVASEQATTAGQVSGSGLEGAEVTAVVSATGNRCTATVDSSGGWTCILSEPLATGSYTVTATQTADFSNGPSAPSASATVLIDKDAPGPPQIQSPGPGARVPLAGSTFSGLGDDGNAVILFAGIRPLCQAAVTGGAWACTATAVPAGTHDVTALQMDTAGNASAASPAVAVTFAETAPTTAAPPAGSPPSSSAPGATSPPAAAPPATGGEGAAPPPVAEPGSPATGATPRWIESLRAPTTLGTSLAPLASVAGPQLATAAGLAAGTVGLVIIPALLAARALRGRLLRLPSMTGRNRSRGDGGAPATPLVDRWTRAIVGTAAAAALLTLSMPVLAQSNYLRLAIAAALAVIVLNLAGTIGVVRAARGLFGVDVVTVTRLPLLALTALTSLVSRMFVLAPPLVAGQILGTRFGGSTTQRQRGNVSLAQLVVTCALALGGWALYSTLPTDTGTLGMLASEGAGLLTLTAATSAAVAALPLGFLPGRALLERSRILWATATTLAWSLLFLVLTAVAPSHTAPALASLAAVAVGFGAVSAAIWLWARFVEPFLRAS
ncbi:MAG: hypothetical protein ABWZ77_00635 [Naasia sp.]